MDAAFPTEVQEFDSDDRISFSKLDNKFIAVHDDGTEFEFDAESKKWVPAEEEHVELDAQDYGGQSSAAAVPDGAAKKRKPDDSENGGKLKPTRPSKKQKQPPPPRKNTAVYVSGLPLDATISEVHDLFSHKGGVIAEEIDSGSPRIKLYTDDSGAFKGDALIVFFKPQSVEMAIMLLDDTDFRITPTGTREGRMRVQAAESSTKRVKGDSKGAAANGGENGNGQGGERPQQRNTRDRDKIIKKTQKLDAKLADWDDDDPYPVRTESTSKKDKTVILRHMFTLAELAEDPAALLEIKEDIRDECSTLGAVTSVILYDLEEDGIVAVRFKDVESTVPCIARMDGRAFDGRRVGASLATGTEKFKKSTKDKALDDSD